MVSRRSATLEHVEGDAPVRGWPRVGWFLSRRIDEIYGPTPTDFLLAFRKEHGRLIAPQTLEGWRRGGRIKWRTHQRVVLKLCRWRAGSFDRMIGGGFPIVVDDDDQPADSAAIAEIRTQLRELRSEVDEALRLLKQLAADREGPSTL